jgi:hypothetical protein
MLMNLTVRLFPRGATGWLWRRLLVTIACTAFADWLLYRQHVGLSLALFLAVLAIAAAYSNPIRAGRRAKTIASAVLAAGLMAVLEDLNLLSFSFGVLGTALFAGIMSSRDLGDWRKQLKYAASTLVPAPRRMTWECLRVRRLARRRKLAKGQANTATIRDYLLAWIVPVGFCTLFLGLFASANPVIESWVGDVYQGIAVPDFVRIGFWVFIIATIWPLIHARPRRRKSARASAVPVTATKQLDPDVLFGKAAILRSCCSMRYSPCRPRWISPTFGVAWRSPMA